jgi:DNA-binding winged helix-turn-helix (wHTH) protein
MTQLESTGRYRFATFEADAATGELRRQGIRIKLNAQPFQVLVMLLKRPGELLTREEISRELWPDGTFVDFEHGVNSAVNRIREALGDSASNPRFIETLARRGYRFLASVERITPKESAPTSSSPLLAAGIVAVSETVQAPLPMQPAVKLRDRILASEDELPRTSHRLVPLLFVLLQWMYLGFYIGALANLAEIGDLFSSLSYASQLLTILIVTATVLIPVRAFLLSAIFFHAPRAREKFLKIWPFVFPLDMLWSLSPFLLLHHINFGLALACTALLVYSPFAQRSLILMGACGTDPDIPATMR